MYVRYGAKKKCLFVHLSSNPCKLCLADAPERNLGTSVAFEGNTIPPLSSNIHLSALSRALSTGCCMVRLLSQQEMMHSKESLPKSHCELRPIEMVGFCKCTIQIFPTHSLSVIGVGLTGKSAEWAVCRQKRHRQASQQHLLLPPFQISKAAPQTPTRPFIKSKVRYL